jgi:hypothetical protein
LTPRSEETYVDIEQLDKTTDIPQRKNT